MTADGLMHSINPATEEMLKSFEQCSEKQIAEALEKANETFRTWRKTSFDERAARMHRAAAYLRHHNPRLATLITIEMGKPISEAEAEIEKCAWNCDFYADNSLRFLQDEARVSNATESYIQYPPLGVILAVLSNANRHAPPNSDIVQLAGSPGQTYVITLSKPVKNPIMAIVSLGARGNPVVYKFTAFAPFTILSQGSGYWGSGSLSAPTGSRGEYVYVWRNVPAGSHNLVVRVVDTFGTTGEGSRSIKVLDTSTVASIAIAQPVPGQLYGDPVPLQVNVTPGAASIAHVDYVNALGRKVATSSTLPFAASWTAPLPGRHAITAVAVQNDGVAVASPTVFFDVAAPGVKQAPLVVLTAPTALGSLNADAPVTVVADALADRGSSIAKVEFFNKGVLIGAATTTPYQITWTGASVGTATLTAKATDSTAPATNSTATSTPITITLTSANPPPTVSLTSPVSGATYAAPAEISLAATASDANGSVTKVEFFAGSTLVGTDTTSPYAFTWSNVPAGTYALTAKATDSGGATSVSAVRMVTVASNAPPQVTLTAPSTGQSFAYGAPIALSANASDIDGSVAQVEFFAGTTRLATDTSAPYAFSWNNAAVGTHSLTARATDNLGTATTSSPASVTVTSNALPTVNLVLPRVGQQHVTGQTINLVATAGDTDGTIARIEFLHGTTVLGTATSAPYAYAWTNVSAGTYAIYARAVDNQGAVRTSSVVTVQVAPLAVTVTSPVENAQIAAASVLVSGTFTAPANSGVIVNGVRARVHGNQFFASDVALVEGANAISVVVVTADETVLTATRNVTRTGTAPIRAYLEPESGFAPHAATIRVDNPGGLTITGVSYENLGAAVLDTTGADQQTLGRLTLASPGIATPTVVVTYSGGNVYRQQVGVLAESKSSVDTLLKEVWNMYTATLAAGRVDLALASLPPVTAARYKPVLEPLAAHFASIIPTWSAPMTGRLADDVGEYTIARSIDGQNRLFFIYFVRDDRGIWRLDSM